MATKLVVYGDCIPIDPVSLEESRRYPGLVASAYEDVELEVIGYSGETTMEAVKNLCELVEKRPDVVILNWGLNDALPRGLERINRSRAIRLMYRLKMGKSLRWFCRTFMLNPVEYLLQFIRKPRFYYTKEQTCEHFKYIVDELRKNGVEKLLVVSINPIKNYRFRKANGFIGEYNDAIKGFCAAEGIPYADVYSKCFEFGLDKTLGDDKFHYSVYGHQVAAGEIKKGLDGLMKDMQQPCREKN